MMGGDKEKSDQGCRGCGNDLGVLILETRRQNSRAIFKLMKVHFSDDCLQRECVLLWKADRAGGTLWLRVSSTFMTNGGPKTCLPKGATYTHS